MHEATELVSSPKPYVERETSVPGDNNVIRVVRMSDGNLHVYYRDRFLGSYVEGNDASLAAVLEATVDYALERKHQQYKDALNSPEFHHQVEGLLKNWLRSNSAQRKGLLERLFG